MQVVISLDWTMDIAETKSKIGNSIALQGNLDPCVLYATDDKIKNEAKSIIDAYGDDTGHIFNLGHGILPNINPEKLKTLVNFVKNYKISN